MDLRLARTLLLAPFLFSLAPTLAQAPASSSASQGDIAGDDRRRILHFEDGRVLRARARKHEGVWQEHTGLGWQDVSGWVVSARPERECLAEAQRRQEELKRSDHDGRVLLARWMIAEGLYPEALLQLDRVLRTEPEHTGALAVIRAQRIELELSPESRLDRDALVRETVLAGVRGSPAVREVAVQRLAELGGFVDVRELVTAEMLSHQQRRREFAVLAARRLFPGEMLREISDRAILDVNQPVREEAARALRDARDVAVLAPAINALASKHANVRGNAVEAMGNIGHAAAVEPLMNHLSALQAGSPTIGHRANIYIGFQTAYVADYDVEIAQAASISDPIVAVQDSGVVLDARATVQMTKVIEMRKVMGSLRQLTAQRIGDDPKAWGAWWQANQERWRSLDRARPETVRPETPGAGSGK
jgi:hypothetical protein